MHSTHLASVDLNLLVAFDVLASERNVTRAAARLGRTQSAMSRTLGRLRDLFEDPLLVRDGHQMHLTPRADALRDPIATMLKTLQTDILAPTTFDPRTARHGFTISTADFVESTLLPLALAHIARAAPGVDIVITDDLTPPFNTEIDLKIGVNPAGANIRTRPLGEEQFSCLVCEDHAPATWDLATYVALPHVLIAPFGSAGGVVDTALAKRGLSRRVAVRTRNFLTAPHMLPGTPRVLTLPTRIARQATSYLPVTILTPPIPVPTFRLHVMWHERRQHDLAHRWFRTTLVDALLAQYD